jgi:hypothetical protein
LTCFDFRNVLKLVIKKNSICFTYNDYVPKVMDEITNNYNEVDVGGEEKANQDLEEAPPPKKAKRGRGRPSKATDSSKEDGSPQPKKGRGRPAAKAGSAKKPTPKKVGTDDLMISIPKREQTSDEVERTHKFAKECIELLRHAPDCRLPFNKFIPAYHHHFGHQCR